MLITSQELLHAWQRLATKRDPEHDADNATLEQIQVNPDAWCGELAHRIAEGKYQPAPLQPIAIEKKHGGQRLLLVPPLVDRLVHSALAQRLSDLLDGRFSPHSYAYRPGTGVSQACATLHQRLAQPGTGWVLDADILDCFDLIDHTAVIQQLTQHGVWQNQAAWLLRQYLQSMVNSAPQLALYGPSCLMRGLPQGSPLSPILCNVVLDVLDKTLTNQNIEFVRYADDFVVLGPDYDSVCKFRELIERTLQPLGLQLHPDKTRILQVVQGFDFLGQHFSHVTQSHHPTQVQTPPTPVERQHAAPPLPADDDSPNDPLLRTLYLLEPHTTLDRDSHQLVVLTPEQTPLKIPAERLHQVITFGSTNITSGAISLCLEMGIPVMLLSGRGRYFGLVDPLKIENLQTQRAQFRALDQPELSLMIARHVVQGKITNQLALLRRWHRHRPPSDTEHTKNLYDALQVAKSKASQATSTDSLRGIEGAAAAAYWRAIKTLLSPTWKFEGRRRQPPPDPVNSLLSYGYTLMYYNLLTLVAARGLNPYAGFMHTPRSGHHALVSDLMEEFRGPIVDALVMDMVQNGRIKPDEFSWPEGQDEACMMSVSARRNFVHAFEKKLNTPQRHTRYGLQMDWRRIMDGQVLHLVQTLHRQNDTYQAYTITP